MNKEIELIKEIQIQSKNFYIEYNIKPNYIILNDTHLSILSNITYIENNKYKLLGFNIIRSEEFESVKVARIIV